MQKVKSYRKYLIQKINPKYLNFDNNLDGSIVFYGSDVSIINSNFIKNYSKIL